MAFGETKVYFDGSHFIAIPHTTRALRKRPFRVEEEITIVEEVKDSTPTENVDVPSLVADNSENFTNENAEENIENNENIVKNTKKTKK